MKKPIVALAFLFAAPSLAASPSVQYGLRVPPGFEVVEFADSKLANDIYCLTVDAQGRVIVSGRGYLRILIDDDGDGKADRAIDFADNPKDGAMGLLWEGNSLYVSGDGGLRRFFDQDGDGKADGPSQLIRAMKTGGEHTAHAIRRGPDGWLYVLCGNTTGIDRSYATTSASPIREPIAGCVLRFSPDLKKSEIVAQGFRNAYAMDFNLDGELFTFDSDNERCVGLPWYEPTRFYHVIPGGHYGWLSPQRCEFWRMPPYFPDVVAPIATLGRGSPTGVVCYRHAQFPKAYRGGFFLCDWTFGKIYFAPVERRGATYTSQPRVFLEAVGDNGFAPTAIALHPKTGDLFVSIGGRGTRGAVYRIRYPQGLTADLSAEAAKMAMPKRPLLEAPPPLSGADFLDRMRLEQKALGDIGSPKARGTVWEGYTARGMIDDASRRAMAARLRADYPRADPNENRELLRTLAMLAAEAPRELPDRWTKSSDPLDDIHELIVWARTGNKDRATEKVAATLLDLDRKITERHLNRDLHWPLRIAELVAGLAEKDPDLHDALVAHPAFGRPDHALFAQTKGFDRSRAAAIFLKRMEQDKEYAVDGSVLGILAALPAEQVNPVVRSLWGRIGQDAAILPLLARQAVPADRPKFVHGLASPQETVVEASLRALAKLPLEKDPEEVFGMLRAWPQTEKNLALRAALRARLNQITGLAHFSDEKGWIAWLAHENPKLAARLTNPDGVDVPAWEQRLARLDFSHGDAERGQAVFVKASCAACHSGAQAVGPDLKGVTKRFSRQDLFTAIVQPSKDVPARYQMTQVETQAGKTYEGIVIYDAVDSLILQIGVATTIRVNGADIASRRTVPRSLMPAGLLEALTDREIADLYAFLQK